MFLLKLYTHYVAEGWAIFTPTYNGACTLSWSWARWWVSRAAPSQRPQSWATWPAMCVPGHDHQRCVGQMQEKGVALNSGQEPHSLCPSEDVHDQTEDPWPSQPETLAQVNGKLRQEGETSSTIFFPSSTSLDSYKVMTLEGDIILTRMPKGSGPVKENNEIQTYTEPSIWYLRWKGQNTKFI